MIPSACGNSRRPDGVNAMPDDIRWKRLTPKCSSSALICPESAG
jgi:hypothetical protein